MEDLINEFSRLELYPRFQRIEPRKLKKPVYIQFENICRTMHIDDVLECQRDGEILNFDVPYEAHSCLSETCMNVMWFGVSKNNSGQNWYGNVSFEINLNYLFRRKRNLKAYYIDHVQFNKDTISRVLITDKDDDELPSDIIELDFTVKGYPLWKDSKGNFHALAQHSRLDGGLNRFGHSLEIVIDADGSLPRYLYRKCKRVAVNHQNANKRGRNGKYQDKVCFKYNKNGDVCPYSNSKLATEMAISKIFGKDFLKN